MVIKTEVTAIFDCPLDIAFKTPILGDATKTLTGYSIIPAVSHFTEDESWGQEGGTRIPYSVKSLLSSSGSIGLDKILVRKENEYWKWHVVDFHQWSMGFTKFEGEFFFRELEENKIAVRWVYRLTSGNILGYPWHWFFTKVIWNGNLKRAIQRMKIIAEKREDIFLYK